MEATNAEIDNPLSALSRRMAEVVERASWSIVAVDARPRVRTSGVLWREGVIVSTKPHCQARRGDYSYTARPTRGACDAQLRCSAQVFSSFLMSEVRASKETCSVYVPRSYAGSKIVPLPWCGSGFAGMVTLFAGIKKALSQSHCRPLTVLSHR